MFAPFLNIDWLVLSQVIHIEFLRSHIAESDVINMPRNKRVSVWPVLPILSSMLPWLNSHVFHIFRHHLFRHYQIQPMLPRRNHCFSLLIQALLQVSEKRVNIMSRKVHHFLLRYEFIKAFLVLDKHCHSNRSNY